MVIIIVATMVAMVITTCKIRHKIIHNSTLSFTLNRGNLEIFLAYKLAVISVIPSFYVYNLIFWRIIVHCDLNLSIDYTENFTLQNCAQRDLLPSFKLFVQKPFISFSVFHLNCFLKLLFAIYFVTLQPCNVFRSTSSLVYCNDHVSRTGFSFFESVLLNRVDQDVYNKVLRQVGVVSLLQFISNC